MNVFVNALSLGCSFLATTYDVTSRLTYVNEMLQPRGPDITVVQRLHGVTFVHNLLSLTGTFTPQPFVADDNLTVALFNGEIYNWRDVGLELQRSGRGGTGYRSDGACILDAYAAWGKEFPRHLEGEYAIVVFDLARKRIVAATDAFAIKPLWVSTRPSGSFGISSYKSPLARAGHTDMEQLEANTVYVWQLAGAGFYAGITLHRQAPTHAYVLRQHKVDGRDWETAFEAAVHARTRDVTRGLALPLSAGFDSGAIHLALLRLGVPHTTYSMLTNNTVQEGVLLQRRLEFARRYASTGRCQSQHVLLPPLNRTQRSHNRLVLERLCEPYEVTWQPAYWRTAPLLKSPKFRDLLTTVPTTHTASKLSFRHGDVLDDGAALGLSEIFQHMRRSGQRVALTGSGADETMTDYGFNGRPVRQAGHSQFGGYWPSDLQLERMFPWRNFYSGQNRNLIAKEEYVSGAHGIEGRWPFLARAVVQEGISLSSSLKNTVYKAGIQLYMRRHGYPHYGCIATADRPFGEGFGCHKEGFAVRNAQQTAKKAEEVQEKEERARGKRLWNGLCYRCRQDQGAGRLQVGEACGLACKQPRFLGQVQIFSGMSGAEVRSASAGELNTVLRLLSADSGPRGLQRGSTSASGWLTESSLQQERVDAIEAALSRGLSPPTLGVSRKARVPRALQQRALPRVSCSPEIAPPNGNTSAEVWCACNGTRVSCFEPRSCPTGVSKRRAVTITFDTYAMWGARQQNYVRLNRVAIERAGADFVLLIPQDAARSAAGKHARTARMATWYREIWPETLKELEQTFTKIVRVPWIVPPNLSRDVPFESGGCCGAREFMKLNAISLTEYDAVINLDSDMKVRGDLRPLFDCAASGYMLTARSRRCSVSGGFFAVKPQAALLDDMLASLSDASVNNAQGWNRRGWGLRHKTNDFRVQGFLHYYLYQLGPPVGTVKQEQIHPCEWSDGAVPCTSLYGPITCKKLVLDHKMDCDGDRALPGHKSCGRDNTNCPGLRSPELTKSKAPVGLS